MIKFRGEDGMVKDCLCEECADAGDCWRLMASCPCPHDEQHECCADLAEDDIGGVMVREEDTDDVGNPYTAQADSIHAMRGGWLLLLAYPHWSS